MGMPFGKRIALAATLLLAVAAHAQNVTFGLEQGITAQAGETVPVKLFLTTDVDLQIATVQVNYGDLGILSLPTGTTDVTVENYTAPGEPTLFPTGASTMVVGAGTFTFGAVVFPAGSTDLPIATLNVKVDPGAVVGQVANVTLSVSQGGGYGAFQSANGSYVSGTTLTNTTVTIVKLFNANDDGTPTRIPVVEDSTNNAIDVLANDTDQTGTAPVTGATVTGITTQPTNGTATFDAGQVYYTPNGDFAGDDSFEYSAQNPAGNTDTGMVFVTVTEVNDAPVIAQGASTGTNVDEDTNVDVNLDATDVDTPLANLSWSVDSGPSHGTAIFQGASTGAAVTVRYTPTGDYFGDDQFTVKVDDGEGGDDTITVDVTVANVNDVPDAMDDPFTVAEDSVGNGLGVLGNDSFLPDPAETFTITHIQGTVVNVGDEVATPNGMVKLVANGVQSLEYTPNGDFNSSLPGAGDDVFTYTINDRPDGSGLTDQATVTVTVTPVNDPPDAMTDDVTVDEDSGANAVDVLGNDTDAPDAGETLTVVSVTQGGKGAVAITGGGTGVSYTPAGNAFGADTFTYVIDDGSGEANSQDTATVNVTIRNVDNDPPTVDDALVQAPPQVPAGTESVPITLSGSDLESPGNPIDFFTIESLPTGGVLRDAAARADLGVGATVAASDNQAMIYFFPDYHEVPPDPPLLQTTFEYSATDSGATDERTETPLDPEKSAANATVTVRFNQPPDVVAVSPGEGTVPTDQDIDENESVAFAASFRDDLDPSGQGAMESITWLVDGVAQEVPAREDPMSSSFEYLTDFDTIANDGTGQRPSSKVVKVEAVGRDTQGGETVVTWNVVVHDIDRLAPAPVIAITPASPQTLDDLIVTIVSQGPDPDGDAIDADPDAGYKYRWTQGARVDIEGRTLDEKNTQKGQTWHVEVRAITDPYSDDDPVENEPTTAQTTIVNTDPIAVGQDVATDEDSAQNIDLAGTDPDIDDGTDAALDFAISALPEHGTVEAVARQDAKTYTYRYTPDANYHGADSFSFTVTDQAAARGVSAPAQVNITVNPLNDPPVPGETSASVRLQSPGGDVSSEVILTATDVDGPNTIAFFTLETVPDPGKGVLRATNDPAGPVLGVGDEIAAANDAATIYFFPLYDAASPVAGAAEFSYSATDNGIPAPGIKSLAVAGGTIGIGTPPWYPLLVWLDPDFTDGTQYNVSIWSAVAAVDRDETADAGELLLRVSVTGRTLLTPKDYINGGNKGLPPGDYVYSVTRHDQFDPAPVVLVDNQGFVVDDYGLPTADSVTSPGREGSAVEVEQDLYEFTFNVGNASGFRIEVTDDGGELLAALEDYFGLITGSGNPQDEDPAGLVEFVGPFTRRLQLPPGSGARDGGLNWRVRGFNPNIVSGTEIVGAKAYGPWSDAAPVSFGDDVNAPCTATPEVPGLIDEPDQTAGQDNSLVITLEWVPVACAEDVYVYVRNYTTGVAEFADWASSQAVGREAPRSITLTLGPGRYVWTATAYNPNADGEPYSGYAAFDHFQIISNAFAGAPGVVGELVVPDTGQLGLGGGSMAPVFQLRCNNANAFDIKLYDYTRRQWTVYEGVSNDVPGKGEFSSGPGTQTLFVGTQIVDDRKYKFQARGRYIDADTGDERVGPWSRTRFFHGGDPQ